jgi:hypothetical protein
MKTMLLKISFIFLLLSLMEAGCKKDDKTPTNIILYDKPLKTIQHHIQGKWKLVYGKGGFCGTCKYYCDNCFTEFTLDNKIISKSFIITTDTTTIRWVRGIGTYTNNDSTYLMTFKDKQGIPWVYVIEQIYNDTLIYHDNSSDDMFYHYVKSN